METDLKRLYVGGLSPLVTKTELADRFGKFGKVDDVDILIRKDEQGNAIKTFAYLNINISDVDLKKCISILNKTKWKGGILQIEMAKESFLHRLSQERQEAKEKNKATVSCSQNDLMLPLASSDVPGTEVPNHKNWVVSKFGRALPVIHFNGKYNKIMKYDPSKYCHNLKTIEDTFEQVPLSQLTWQLQGGDDDISRKRRGEFPNLTPPIKRKKKLLNLPICDDNDRGTDEKISFRSMQTIKRQSEKMSLHNKKIGHLQNKAINIMIDSKDEHESVFKSEQAKANSANDCNIEVVDDSFNLGDITHRTKPKSTPKIYSTCNNTDDSEYDSANTDEIITVAKSVQQSWDYFKSKAETVKRDAIKILDSEGCSYACGTKDKCKSRNNAISKLESGSESGTSEDDSCNSYSDNEYNAMMQNCFKLDLTMRNLRKLTKEANKFENEKNAYDGGYDTDGIHVNKGFGVAENQPAQGSGVKDKTQVSKKYPESNDEQKEDVEPKDIVASILEDENDDQQSTDRRKKNASVKPPAFKGICSMLTSAAIVNSLSSSITLSSAKNSTVSNISKDLRLSSCSSKQAKRAEKHASKDFKPTFLKAGSENGSSNSDECNRVLGMADEFKVEQYISQLDTMKEQTLPKVRQQQDNQKRLVAISEWRKERELQKQIIQGALLHSDCSKNSQHVVFSSESASEKEDDDASTSVKKSIHADNKLKESTSKLFSSSEEDSDNEGNEADERFTIKAQYEGRSGIKLMELQSTFGKDERFKMDSRFLESSSEDDEASDAYKSHVNEEYDLSAEKMKNLDILQSILNIKTESQPATKQTTKGKQFKNLNVFHYDPSKANDATLATQAEERQESKYEKTKKKLEKLNLPDVPKETFHEIIMDLKEVFGTLKTQNRKEPGATWDQDVEPEKKKSNKSNESFSFQNTEEPVEFKFSFFGNATEGRTSNNEPYKVEPIKPAKVVWQEDPRFQDSSEGEDDEVDAAGAAKSERSLRTSLLVSTRPDISTIRIFSFVKDEERLKTRPAVFFRSSTAKQEEEAREQRKNILLEECRKRHKDAKRKIKAKN